MRTTLVRYTVEEISKGFVFNELEGKGLFGLNGRLTIQPEYQRHFIYAEEGREAGVVDSLLRGYPLGLIYFVKNADKSLEVLDGQQRITSFGRFITDRFAIVDPNDMPQYFSGLAKNQQRVILDSELLVYECEGTETEIKEWFRTINIAGVPLTNQELLNAVYSGPFVTLGKAEFSNSQNANIQKWSSYVRGSALRQDYWERALQWIAGDDESVGEYMSNHRYDTNINEVKSHFNSVIDWISSVFDDVEKEMCGLEWDRLYREYRHKKYSPTQVSKKVQSLYSDPFVKSRRGIFEYVLGDCKNHQLLDIRVFDERVKRIKYNEQTKIAKAKRQSNCSLCAVGKAANKTKIWTISEMEADHVKAWSKGGDTSARNCEMLCRTHNRAKGNS